MHDQIAALECVGRIGIVFAKNLSRECATKAKGIIAEYSPILLKLERVLKKNAMNLVFFQIARFDRRSSSRDAHGRRGRGIGGMEALNG